LLQDKFIEAEPSSELPFAVLFPEDKDKSQREADGPANLWLPNPMYECLKWDKISPQ